MKSSSILLKLARMNNKLSQSELAIKLGLTSPQFISNIERGLVSVPPSRFLKLTRILKGLSVFDLIKAHAAEAQMEAYNQYLKDLEIEQNLKAKKQSKGKKK